MLADRGVEGFTLRECARRAGVSHAAPAHHFRDARALLTALATIGFERLTAAMARRSAALAAASDRFAAIGVGYVAFARAHPHHVGLMFRSEALDRNDPAFCAAAAAAFGTLVRETGALLGEENPLATARGRAAIAGAWSMVHGLATLTNAGHLQFAEGSDAALEDLAADLTRTWAAAIATGTGAEASSEAEAVKAN